MTGAYQDGRPQHAQCVTQVSTNILIFYYLTFMMCVRGYRCVCVHVKCRHMGVYVFIYIHIMICSHV